MKRNAIYFLILIWLLAACRSEPAAVPTPTVPPTATTVPPTPPPSATATPSPSPTPILPQLSVTDQTVDENGRILVEQVVSPDAGWLVVLAQVEDEGEAGVLGFAPVAPGLNESVIVEIDPIQATPELTAVLFTDGGDLGVFEYPGPDMPLTEEAAAAAFAIDLNLPMPTITIADQDITENGEVAVAEVFAMEPGWLFIHADEDGVIGDLLGFTQVKAGGQENLVVSIQWRQATSRLYAVLHQDAGQPNRMDGVDSEPPVVVNGSPVVVPFSVTLPLDVFVLDQPVVEEVVVERVFVNEPAWLVIYFDEDGQPGRIIGFAPLQAGVNEQIVTPVVETAVTSPLHILIHEDTTPGDDFDFPANDPPLRVNDQFQNSVRFNTNPGSYFFTEDQVWQIEEDGETATVNVPIVVLDRNVWLVIYNDVDGVPTEIVGRVALPPGIYRNVPIEIDLAAATDVLYAALHRNEGDLEAFDFPEGVDSPFGGQTNLVRSPFTRIAEPSP